MRDHGPAHELDPRSDTAAELRDLAATVRTIQTFLERDTLAPALCLDLPARRTGLSLSGEQRRDGAGALDAG